MFRNVKPLGKDILVEKLDTEQKTIGGLFIPDEANEFGHKLYRAQVLEVGSEVVSIHKDMIILCKFGTGISVDYDVIMMKENELIGRF